VTTTDLGTALPGAVPAPAARRTDVPVAEGQLDVELQKAIASSTLMRQAFYVVVLLVALGGQVSGAVEALHIPLLGAIPAVGALELGGIVVLNNADVRRRLGERATASRLLSAAIAVGAVAFNWLAHANHLLGGFFAGMSALGYLVWLMHTENQRRDRLRAKGDLPPTTPAYELVGHWLSHPWLTRRARSLAKARPGLGLYESLDAAREQVRQQRRQKAISKVLHRKIRAAVDPTVADIAIAVYDLDEIAGRLAEGADYAGLTALLAADLDPARVTATAVPGRRRRSGTGPAGVPVPASLPGTGAAVLELLGTASGTAPAGTAGTGRPALGAGTGEPIGTGRARHAVVAAHAGTGQVVTARTAVPAGERGAKKAAARAYWETEVAAGRTPAGGDLAKAAGQDGDETGVFRRWAREWAAELAPAEGGGASASS
jgi:hypothetical protein